MKLDRLNTWLNLFGQLAVFAGLVALVFEIRGNTQSLRAQELALIDERNSTRQLVLMDPGVRGMYAKALFDPEQLTVDEMIGVTVYLSYRVATLATVYQRAQEGTLLDSDWEATLTSSSIYLGSKFGRKWWEEARADYIYDPRLVGFVEAIDRSLEEATVIADDVFYIRLCKRMELAECPPSTEPGGE